MLVSNVHHRNSQVDITAPGHHAGGRAATDVFKIQIYSFLSLDRSVRLFHKGDRRCGPALGRSGQDFVWIRDRDGMWEQ